MKYVCFGDIFSVIDSGGWKDGPAKHHYIVHGCNAQGVMGSGIAKTIKERFPKVFAQYQDQHGFGGLELGSIIPVQVCTDGDASVTIVNAITQENYGRDSSKRYVSYLAIQKAFRKVRNLQVQRAGSQFAPDDGMIHYPLIGAGLGGGDWSIISATIDEILHQHHHCMWVQD